MSSSVNVLFILRFMIKRAQGRNRFGMKNFKKRWFRLTNHEFTYHKTKGELEGFLGISLQLRCFLVWSCHCVRCCDDRQEGENLLSAHPVRTRCASNICGEDYWAGNAFLCCIQTSTGPNIIHKLFFLIPDEQCCPAMLCERKCSQMLKLKDMICEISALKCLKRLDYCVPCALHLVTSHFGFL